MQATNIEGAAPLYLKLCKSVEQSRKCVEVGDLQCPKQAICTRKTAAESTAAAASEKSSSDQIKPNQTTPSHSHYPVDPVSATRSNQPQRPKPKLNHSASTGNRFSLHVKIEALHPKQPTPNRTETSSFHATEPNAGSS